MAQIDILKEVLEYSLRKFEHKVIGSSIYFMFNDERYAVAKLKQVEPRLEYNGVSIIYISKLFGKIDQCDIYFKDVFVDKAKRATINVDNQKDEYAWHQSLRPEQRDLSRLAEHIERYIGLVEGFITVPENLMAGPLVAASMIIGQGISNPDIHKQLLEHSNIMLQTPEKEYYEEILPHNIEDKSEKDEINNSINDDGFDNEGDVINNNDIINNAPNTSSDSEIHDNVVIDNNSIKQEDPIVLNCETIPDIKKPDSQDVVLKEENKTPIETEANNIPLPPSFDNSSKDIDTDKKDVESYQKPSKKGFFGRFTGKEHSKNVLSQEEVEAYKKPFISWKVGASKPDDVTASLFKIDKDNLRLEFFGNGDMANFKKVPWLMYSSQISQVVIHEGVLNIGNNAFKSFSSLASVELPSTLRKIGASAFEFCSALTDINLPEGLKIIDIFAFSSTENLKIVKLPESIVEVRDYAFEFIDDFHIYSADAQKIYLGAGLSYEDFESYKMLEKANTKFSAKTYLL